MEDHGLGFRRKGIVLHSFAKLRNKSADPSAVGVLDLQFQYSKCRVHQTKYYLVVGRVANEVVTERPTELHSAYYLVVGRARIALWTDHVAPGC